MKKSLFVFAFFYLSQFAFAQDDYVTISGKVVDRESQKSLEMVNIHYEGKAIGTVSNSEGGFEIYYSAKKSSPVLLFSFIGYKTFRLTIKDLAKTQNLIIILEPDATFLNEIVIRDKKTPPVKDILANVVKKMPDNYPTEPYIYEAFYREYMMDLDTCKRLIEAAVEVYDKKGYSYWKPASQQMFMKINHLRSTYDFSKFKNNNGLIDKSFPEQHNWLRLQRIIFDEDRQKVMQFRFVQQTILEDDVLYEINFVGEEVGAYLKIKGTVWINAKDFAVERLSFKYTPNFHLVGAIDRESDYSFRVYNEIEENLVFKKENGKYFLAYQNKRSKENYQDDLTQYDDSHSETFVELLTTQIQTEKVTGFEDSKLAEIKALRYDPIFWKTFTTPADTPQDQKRKADLEKMMALEKQYVEIKK